LLNVWYDKINDFSKLNEMQKFFCVFIYKKRIETDYFRTLSIISSNLKSDSLEKNLEKYYESYHPGYDKEAELNNQASMLDELAKEKLTVRKVDMLDEMRREDYIKDFENKLKS